MTERIDDLIKAVECLSRKVAQLKTAIKTRNEMDSKSQERDMERERAAAWERRFLLVVICILAGVDAAKLTGLIK